MMAPPNSDIKKFTQTTVYSHTPVGQRLPPWAWNCLTFFHWIHCIWLGYRVRKLITSPAGISCAAVGLTLNALFSQHACFRIVVHLLAAAERLQGAIQAHLDFYNEWQAIKRAVQGDFRRRVIVQLPKKGEITPSLQIRWYKEKSIWKERIRRLARHVAALFKALIELSLRLYDNYQGLASISQGCPAPGLGTLCDASRYAQRLCSELQEQKELIARILNGVGSSFGVNNLTSWLAEKAGQAVSAAPDRAIAVVKHLGARSIFDVMVMLGCSELFPKPLLPPPIPSWGK